jgi:putative heme iron utilization protein
MSRLKDHIIGIRQDIEQEIENKEITNFKQLKDKYGHIIDENLLKDIWDDIPSWGPLQSKNT